MAACLLRLDGSNSDDRCTWKSLWVGLLTFNDLPLLTSLKILVRTVYELRETVCRHRVKSPA